MKLATRRTGSPDGRLVVVSHDLSRIVAADPVSPTLQAALDDWDRAAPQLAQLAERLNGGDIAGEPYNPGELAAPLPRAWQFLDGSAFPTHGALMQRAFHLPQIETDMPLMYQGMSHRFLGPLDSAPFRTEADGIDFEAEIAVITGEVPMGADAACALQKVRLIGLLNDWSLRAIAPIEMKTGFGWVQAKPASAMAPVVVTPDEFGTAWSGGRLHVVVQVWRGETPFGAVPAAGMQPGFGELLAHAAATRDLCSGTILGSGTVSCADAARIGSCCIAERRALELIEGGVARTGFLQFGERVRIRAVPVDGADSVFGDIDQSIMNASGA